MRIARTTEGFVLSDDGDGWIPAAELGHQPRDIGELIEVFDELRAAVAGHAGDRVRLTRSELRWPVPRPSKILAIGRNYLDHVNETGADVPERPVLFAKYPSALNDPYGDIVLEPDLTQQGDYEVELAVVIGTPSRRVPVEHAEQRIFGYAVANDVTARDWQMREDQHSRSKGYDTFCPIGPWITTADEVDPQQLGIRSWVNGELRQEASTEQMIFPVATLIAFLSQTMTLEAGDVILTGTPQGVGFAMDPPRFLRPGDVVRCEIDGLGDIENTVIAGVSR